MTRMMQQFVKPMTTLTLMVFVGNLLFLCCINMASAAPNMGSEKMPPCHSMSSASEVDLDSAQTKLLSTQDSVPAVCCDFASDYLSANQADQVIGSLVGELSEPAAAPYDRIELSQTLASNCSLLSRGDALTTVPIYLVDCAFLE